MSIWKIAEHVLTSVKGFAKSDRGNLAIMGGIAMIPLMVAGGAAVDYERAVNTKTGLMASLDQAALYAASLSDTDNATLTTKSKMYLQSNWPATGGATLVDYAVVNNGNTVTATSTAQIPNYFMSIVGNYTTKIGASSTVDKMGINLEVSLVLDNTNSMNSTNPQTGNTAIADLKTSAVKFLDMVMPTTQGLFYTKVAAIPYGNAVNLGTTTLATQARGPIAAGTGAAVAGLANISFTPYTGGSAIQLPASTLCVTERQGVNAYNDSAIDYRVGFGTPVGYQYGPSGNNCLVKPIQALTTVKADLANAINAMVAGGSTAGQNGIAWGWYALSPTVGLWSGTSIPAGYDKLTTTDLTKKVRKVMVMMTDGEYNSAYCNGVISGPSSLTGSGSQSSQIGCASPLGNSYTQSNAMCTAIKNAKIEVFVITFQLDKTNAQRVALTQNCATDASHVIDADTTSLDAAFKKIANSIVAMRIAS